jgi:hypothetical protein
MPVVRALRVEHTEVQGGFSGVGVAQTCEILREWLLGEGYRDRTARAGGGRSLARRRTTASGSSTTSSLVASCPYGMPPKRRERRCESRRNPLEE